MMQAKKNRDARRFEAAEGPYLLCASAQWIGPDLLVSIRGGTEPHIGAVALAQPRPSLRDARAVSATASVLCALGHKEDDLVKAASERLAASLKTRVVVTAGIHWDNLDRSGIRTVVRLSRRLIDQISERMTEEIDAKRNLQKEGRKP